MKRFSLITLLTIVSAALVTQFSLAPARPPDVEMAAPSREALAAVKKVDGKPTEWIDQAQTKTKAVSGEVLVRLASDADAAKFGDKAQKLPGERLYRILLEAGESVNAGTTRLTATQGVEAANPNYVVVPSVTPNDSLYASYQWNLPKISAPAAWDKATGNPSVIVAVLDTGVNYNHEDFSGKLWTNSGEIAGNNIDDDGDGYVDDVNGFDFVHDSIVGGLPANDANGPLDDHGHGSLTASVVAATTNNSKGIAGIGWQTKVMPVKVLGTDGYGAMSDIAAGIRYATAAGAKVISMSLGAFGVSNDVATDSAIANAQAAGVTLVAASGNDSSNSVISYPANNPSVIAVGATDSNDARASYSNAGSQLSLVAPGSSIASVDGVLNVPASPLVSIDASSGSLAAGSYRYYLSALNAAGETITSQPTSGSPDINLISVSGTQAVRLSWSSVSGATGYRVYRTAVGDPNGPEKLLVTLGATTSYVDNGSTPLSATLSPAVTTALLNSSYATATGTSLAAPHVAGAAALLLGQNPSLTPAQVRTALENSANKVSGMNGQARTDAYGYGRLNINSLLTALPQYTGVVVGQSAAPAFYNGQSVTMTVDVKNTGLQSWSNSGPQQVRLGTSSPYDRRSGFAGGAWQDLNRVGTFSGRLEANGSVSATSTINPNETARFTFVMRNNGVPLGTYPESFQLVVDGVTWMPSTAVSWNVASIPTPPRYSAAWAGQVAPGPLNSGDQATVSIDFTNTGTDPWTNTGVNQIKLAPTRPGDVPSPFASETWQLPWRVGSFTGRVDSGVVTPTSTINPGETARFSFKMTGPPQWSAATLRQYFRLVVDGVTWLEDRGVYLESTVAPRTYAYTYAGQSNPPVSMTPGQRVSVSIDITNSGTATWKRGSSSSVRLGTSNPRDRSSAFANETWLAPHRIDFAGKVASGSFSASDTINPGETARFSFDMTAPNGLYGPLSEYFTPVVDGFSWLPDTGIYLPTFIPNPNGPDYDFQYIGQTAFPTISQGGTATLKLQIRNIGKQTWSNTGQTALKLGTSRPLDRGSGFYTAGSWEAPNRIPLKRNLSDNSKNVGNATTVAPGETGEFEFVVTGNPSSGSYDEFFRPVIETVTWMKDLGIMWRVTVQRPIRVALSSQSSTTITGTGPISLHDDSGQNFGSVQAGTSITLGIGATYTATVGSTTYSSTTPIHADQGFNSVITVSNLADNGSFNQFRGGIYMKAILGLGNLVINEVDFEAYLKGGGEVPDSWPAEAIKAQTVAARTYAARKMSAPSHPDFNVYDDTRDQVYNGYLSEAAKPNTASAVDATRGVVMYYGGQLVQAYYSSDTGGASENNENVWGGTPIPYLRGVSDPYQKPDVWSKTVSNATLQSNFGVSGNIDTINVLEAYPSGRVKTIQFITPNGTFNKTYLADSMRSRLTTRSSLLTGIGRSGNDWVFSGRGFGHGIGMGQWGAYNQALQGRNYQQILQFYYTGVNFQGF